MTRSIMLHLTKHHGLGNDFVVALDGDLGPLLGADDDVLAAVARHVCDRRRGVGADGLIIGTTGLDGPATMVLYNGDGSRAEMSGNGIRCLAQAIARRVGSLATQSIHTDAGVRTVELAATDDAATIMATVDMGTVTLIDAPHGWARLGTDPGRPVAHLSLGNPHSVVPVEDVRAVDLAALGALVPHVNLEIVEAGPEPDAITMRVHERGAGITEACGTGACAAAFAAARWGLAEPAGGKLVVRMDGGRASVVLRPDPSGGPTAVSLQGPSTYIADLAVPVPS
jgi:diaminopimelate epimerase